MYSVSLMLFERLEGDEFFGSSPHENLKDPGSKATVTTKIERFDQVTVCLGILERKAIVLMAEVRASYGV